MRWFFISVGYGYGVYEKSVLNGQVYWMVENDDEKGG